MSDQFTTSEALAAEIARLRKAQVDLERDEADRRRAETPIQWRYTVQRCEPRDRGFDDIFDPSCSFVRIAGEVVNREAAEAAGHASHTMTGGAMRYIFNDGLGRIVASCGGGTIYVSSSSWRRNDAEAVTKSAHTTMAEISRRIDVVDGDDYETVVDITDLIEAHKAVKS